MNRESQSPSVSEMKRSKRMLAELTLYEDKTEDVHIFTEARLTRNGDKVEIKAVHGPASATGGRLFSLTATGEESVSLIIDRLMPIYLVNNDSKTYDTAIAENCNLPPVYSTCRRIKNTISDNGGEIDVLYDVNLAFVDVYPKRIHLTLREDNRK